MTLTLGTVAMRIQTYRDESRSRHFDLVYGGDRARSIDLVSVTAASLLIASFACALVIPFMPMIAHLSQ
jgi:hypothetical protein